MKTLFNFLKGVFVNVFDILIVGVELLLCAAIVLFLIEHPLVLSAPSDPPGAPRSISTPTPIVTPVPTPVPPTLFLPDVEWVPPTWGPAKYWGYADKYSPTELRRLPGYWRLAYGPRPPVAPSWCSPVVYYEVWNIPSLLVETF